MPTYDYQCNNCGHKFEKFQSMTASVLRKCPECGKMELKRLIGAGAGVIFKGSGFYETDYRSDGYKQSAKKDSPKSDDTAGKKETASSDATKTTDKTKTTSEGSGSGKKDKDKGK